MTGLPIIDQDVRAAAEHGSWCPKLCNHACPVLAATGRNEAVPWGFHRTVSDLAAGRLSPAAAADGLHDCTGCLACRVPCVFDQDVPAQVRAGRAAVAAAGAPVPGLPEARDAVATGRSPFGVPRPELPREPAATDVTVLVGCRDTSDQVAAFAALCAAADVSARFVTPDGCCGGVLRDLGAPDAADVCSATVLEQVASGTVVALDPHCLDELAPARPVDALTFLDGLLADGRLRFADADATAVTYHDPCLLARAPTPVVDAPRRLLAAAGCTAVEPEGHGHETVCSGAGLAYGLVDPEASIRVAADRRGDLSTGATVVTACSGARARLSDDDAPVADLFALLAARLPRTTT